MEFAITEIFSDFEQDPDSFLYFVNTLPSHVTTVPFEFLSVPLVTAADDDSASILWLLNMWSAYNNYDMLPFFVSLAKVFKNVENGIYSIVIAHLAPL